MRLPIRGPQEHDTPRHLWFWLYYNWKTKKIRIYRLEEWGKLKRDLDFTDDDDRPGGRRLGNEEQIYRGCIVLPCYVGGAGHVFSGSVPQGQVLMADYSYLADICKPFPGPEQPMEEYLSNGIARAMSDILPPYQYVPHGGGVSSGILRGTGEGEAGTYVEFGDPCHRYEIVVRDCGEVESIQAGRERTAKEGEDRRKKGGK